MKILEKNKKIYLGILYLSDEDYLEMTRIFENFTVITPNKSEKELTLIYKKDDFLKYVYIKRKNWLFYDIENKEFFVTMDEIVKEKFNNLSDHFTIIEYKGEFFPYYERELNGELLTYSIEELYDKINENEDCGCDIDNEICYYTSFENLMKMSQLTSNFEFIKFCDLNDLWCGGFTGFYNNITKQKLEKILKIAVDNNYYLDEIL